MAIPADPHRLLGMLVTALVMAACVAVLALVAMFGKLPGRGNFVVPVIYSIIFAVIGGFGFTLLSSA